MSDIYFRVMWLVHLRHVTCGVVQSDISIFTKSQNKNTKVSLQVFCKLFYTFFHVVWYHPGKMEVVNSRKL